jgi:hypothetical protein
MVRALFLASVVLIVLLTIINSVVIGTAHYWSPHQEMEGFLIGFHSGCDDQPQPCWFGIIPGVTTVAETERILRAAGYEPTYRPNFASITYGRVEAVIPCSVHLIYDQSTTPIFRIQFTDCSGLQFGDFINALGFPDSVLPSDNRTAFRYEFHTEILAAGSLISPFSPISGFELRPNVMVQASFGIDWKGFQPQGWYCREQFGQDRERYC